MSRLARTIPVVAVAAVSLTASASHAGAAVTIGQTFFPATAGTCNAGAQQAFEVLQTGRASGPSYAAPSDGVITSWSFEAGAAQTVLTLKVFRPTGTAHQYQAIAEGSALQIIPASSGLHTTPTQVPVQAGDFVGIRSTSGDCATQTNNTADTYEPRVGDISQVGTTATFLAGFSGFIFDISAKLEPDCDKDGLGDETQDTNTASCKITCQGQQATIVGTNGNDVRSGTPGKDVMVGQGGNDKLSGLAGKDLICGGAGKDTLKGGGGKDTLLGQAGKDSLKGGGGKDLCKGGKGKDTATCETEKSI